MPLTVSYDLRAIKKPAAMFRKLAEAGEDTKPLAEEITSYLMFSTDRRFETETDPDGQAWQETARGGAILQKTNRLRRSITPKPTEDEARIFTNMIYARIHNEGGTIVPKNKKFLAFMVGGNLIFTKQVKIPKRQYMGINDDDRREILTIAEDYFADVMEAH